MSNLIELVINSLQRYAGHKTDAKSHAEHIVNDVLDEAIEAVRKVNYVDIQELRPNIVFAIEKLKQPTG